MARIEEQQKAINDLKKNLMEDLNQNGVLDNPQCRQVIEEHEKKQAELNQKMSAQRSRQEEVSRYIYWRIYDVLEKIMKRKFHILKKMLDACLRGQLFRIS